MTARPVIALAAALALGYTFTVGANPVELKLDPQPLSTALREFARQTGIQVAIKTDFVEGKTAPSLHGTYEPADALEALLQGTGLVAYPVNQNTYGIRRISDATAALESKTGALRLAQTDAHPEDNSAQSGSSGLEEVVVTATKRKESLQKLPQAITAITNKRLDDLNALSFQDYFRDVPGLMLNTDDRGHQDFSIRGLNGFSVSIPQTTATVGEYIDEVPATSTDAQIDMRLVDIDHIEVLRGPQGTYYGEGSLGGTVRILTKKPDLSRFAATAEGRVSQTAHGGTNNQESLLVNLPLIKDKLALRANYFNAADSGYIDVVNVTDQASATIVGPFKNNDNYTRADGGRVMALFAPSDSVTILAESFHTKTRSGRVGGFDPTVGDLLATIVCSSSPPGPGGGPPAPCFDTKMMQRVDLDNLTATVDLGSASLVSATSWARTERDQINYPAIAGTPTPASSLGGGDAIAEELRLVSSKGWSDHWDYALGVFGNRKRRNNTGAATSGPNAIQVVNNDRELAFFGEAGYQFNAHWSARFGLRESNMWQKQSAALPGSPNPGEVDHKYHPVTGRALLNYSFNDDFMVYSSISNGFRRGGANIPSPSPDITVPASYDPDKAINYEIGWKTAFPSLRATLNGAVYHIDWKNAQTQAVAFAAGGGLGVNYYHNTGNIRVDGFELEGVTELARGLTLQGAISLIDARLGEDYVLGESPLRLGGLKGDKVPFVAPVSGSLSLNYRHGFRDSRFSGFGILNAQYQGERHSDFNAQLNRLYAVMDAYWITGAQLGVESDQWRVALYVENIFDDRAQLYLIPSAVPGRFTQTTTRPRTVGLFLRHNFD